MPELAGVEHSYVTTNFPGEVELVDRAGHFLPEEVPQLVAERIPCG
jgi:hypothetical protein